LVGFQTPSLHLQSLGEIHAYICGQGMGPHIFFKRHCVSNMY
jgi:hypothetical protein